MGKIHIQNNGESMVVVSQMQVVAANAPNASALFNEQLEIGQSVEMDVDDNTYLVVRPFNPVPVEADNNKR